MVLVIGRGIGQGSRTALLTALGMTLFAGVIQILLLVLGVASLLSTSPLAFELLRWVGAAYLVWLGLKLLINARPGAKFVDRKRLAEVPNMVALREGLINNLTNPKSIAFLFAFLPQFIDPGSGSLSVTSQLLLLGFIAKFSNFLILSGVAVSAGSLGGYLSRHPGWIVWQERFAGAVMVGLGLKLALSGGQSAR
ncbi:lysine transporter LysE [Phyllobacterium phragmitis]|uniref:Lysine transporter LysE n=2 Tax=Phyllobacterium phragmitis TaxID=2670329 RepID=A0A2S9IN89_9HYPH|nr:lysine transporter LysE [Phyllobacterium phragmitis]